MRELASRKKSEEATHPEHSSEEITHQETRIGKQAKRLRDKWGRSPIRKREGMGQRPCRKREGLRTFQNWWKPPTSGWEKPNKSKARKVKRNPCADTPWWNGWTLRTKGGFRRQAERKGRLSTEQTDHRLLISRTKGRKTKTIWKKNESYKNEMIHSVCWEEKKIFQDQDKNIDIFKPTKKS